MNKHGFIEKLKKETGLDERDCIIINDCFENHFFIGKKNKDLTVNEISEKLEVSIEKADEIYDIASKIIATAIKNKLKHPFRTQD